MARTVRRHGGSGLALSEYAKSAMRDGMIELYNGSVSFSLNVHAQGQSIYYDMLT